MYLKEKNKVHDGVQYKYLFPNGYGASVIRHQYSYGGKEGLWEIAPLDQDGEFIGQSMLGWTDDVQGHLTNGGVNAILVKLQDIEITN